MNCGSKPHGSSGSCVARGRKPTSCALEESPFLSARLSGSRVALLNLVGTRSTASHFLARIIGDAVERVPTRFIGWFIGKGASDRIFKAKECCQFGAAFWLSAFLYLLLNLSPASAATFSATLDRNTMTAGESATLILTFSGGEPQSNPAVPSVAGLSINYAAHSREFNIVAGRYSSSLIYKYVITAVQPGEFTIPAIRAQVDGAILASQPLTLKVLKDDQAGASAEFAFLKLIVPKTEVYVGELFPAEIQLYVVSAQDLQQPQFKSDGFVIGKRTEPRQGKVQAGNMIYSVVNFKMSVAAAKVGTLTLGPAECNLTLRIPRANRRSRDPFDSFPSDLFPDFFGRREELRPTTLVSEPLTLRVLPLPTQNVPPAFNGALGNFQFSATASPTNLTVGDPITLRVLIKGKGTLDSLNMPAPDWREFKTYPPSSTVTNTDELGLEGIKTFEQVIIPQNAEVKALPPLAFSFFDPEQRTFRTLTQPSITLSVRPGAAAPAQPTILAGGAQSQDAPPPAKDIVHIKSRLGVVVKSVPRPRATLVFGAARIASGSVAGGHSLAQTAG